MLVLLADAGASGTCEHLRTLVNDQGSKPWTHSRTGTLTYMFEELLSKIPTSRAPSQNTDPFAALEPPSRAAVALGMLWDPGLQRLCNFSQLFTVLHYISEPCHQNPPRDAILSQPLLLKAEAKTGPRFVFNQPQIMAEAVVVFPVPGGP